MTARTVLITGGRSGIGAAAARLLLADGYRVAVTGRARKSWTRSSTRRAASIRITSQLIELPGRGLGWGAPKSRAGRRTVTVPRCGDRQ